MVDKVAEQVKPPVQPKPAEAAVVARPQISKDVTVAATAAASSPEAARAMIELMAAGNNYQEVVRQNVDGLKKAGVKIEGDKATVVDAPKIALALDVETAGIQWRLALINDYEGEAQKSKKPLSKESKAKLDQEKKDLQDRLKLLSEQRTTGKILVDRPDGKQVEVESVDVKNGQNELAAFVKGVGVAEKDAQENPLGAFVKKTNEVIQSGDDQQIGKYADDVSRAANFNDEEKKRLKDFLHKSDVKEASKLDKVKNIALYGTGGISVLMILMMWLASKQQGQGAAGG